MKGAMYLHQWQRLNHAVEILPWRYCPRGAVHWPWPHTKYVQNVAIIFFKKKCNDFFLKKIPLKREKKMANIAVLVRPLRSFFAIQRRLSTMPPPSTVTPSVVLPFAGGSASDDTSCGFSEVGSKAVVSILLHMCF